MVLALATTAAALLAACTADGSSALRPPPPSSTEGILTTSVETVPYTAAAPGTVAQLHVEVLETRPHDATAFTQGLEVVDGRLYESTGLVGASTVREVDPATGAVLRRTALAPNLFGEGLTAVGDRLVQLTWKDGVVLVWDQATLALVDQIALPGEGWGLCYDAGAGRLVQSDGTATLTFRDPDDLTAQGQVAVSEDGRPVARLNELECDARSGLVWANVWLTDAIVGIDPGTGQVRVRVDASALRPAGVGPNAVLNGIASLGDGRFLVTGKLWPQAFVVRFVS